MLRSVDIAGGGVAGLTLAISLRRARKDISVRVFEKLASHQHKHGIHIGLWSPALRALQKMGIYSKLSSKFEPVLKSCYRSMDGYELASPTVGLGIPKDDFSSPTLMFIEEKLLMDELREVLLLYYRSTIDMIALLCTHVRTQ